MFPAMTRCTGIEEQSLQQMMVEQPKRSSVGSGVGKSAVSVQGLAAGAAHTIPLMPSPRFILFLLTLANARFIQSIFSLKTKTPLGTVHWPVPRGAIGL